MASEKPEKHEQIKKMYLPEDDVLTWERLKILLREYDGYLTAGEWERLTQVELAGRWDEQARGWIEELYGFIKRGDKR